MTPQVEILLTAVFIAAACSLPGIFLVLRNMSMMSDAITHTILLGIVITFFLTGTITSPFMLLGAVLMGVGTVILSETLYKTKLVSEDSAIGIIFPLLFSIAILLISKYAGSVHLDTDSVLLGELAFVPFDRVIINGTDIGAKAMYISAALFILNFIIVKIFFKELKLTTFDPVQATMLGIAPIAIHYGHMTIVSITAVGAFEAVGSVLVVAFMIGPPIAAYLLTNDLKQMIYISMGIGAICGILGFVTAFLFDVSIAGMMAVMVGVVFFLVLLFSPKKGILTALLFEKNRRISYVEDNILAMLYLKISKKSRNKRTTLNELILWIPVGDKLIEKALQRLEKRKYIVKEEENILLTPEGYEVTRKKI